MATQVFYPDMYNGAFVACPDPIDFHGYTNINLYEDKNAFSEKGLVETIERPAKRDYLGHITATQRDENHMEPCSATTAAPATSTTSGRRSSGRRAPDGYPAPICDKQTGEIDPRSRPTGTTTSTSPTSSQRDWATLGPKLTGKLHIYVGSADTYFLTDAVYFAQDTLESLKTRPGAARSPMATAPSTAGTAPTLSQRLFAAALQHHVPAQDPGTDRQDGAHGADLTSWRY